jgi:hypothetical protein
MFELNGHNRAIWLKSASLVAVRQWVGFFDLIDSVTYEWNSLAIEMLFEGRYATN